MKESKRIVGIVGVCVVVMALFTMCPTEESGGSGPLSAPSNVYVKGATTNSITIGWDGIPGAERYNVFRSSISTGNYIRVSGEGIKDVSYTDNELAPDANYYYKVCAVDGNNVEGYESLPLLARTEKIPDSGLLTAPSNVYFKGATSNSITIGWDGVPGAARYKVYRASVSTATYICVNGEGVTAVSYTNSDLAPSANYYYKVRAVDNEAQEGDWSDYISASTEGGSRLPTTSVMVDASKTTKDSITLYWETVPRAVKYEIWRGATDVGEYNKYDETVESSYTNSGLLPGKTYYYKVKALGNNGEASDLSIYVRGTTLNEEGGSQPSDPSSNIPAAPSAGPTVTSGDGRLTISWALVSGATSYEVYLGTSNNSLAASKWGEEGANSALITGLTNGATYFVWIKAKNQYGISDYSPAGSGVPQVPLPAAPEPSLTGGAGFLTLSWAAVAGATSYEVYYSETDTPPVSPAVVSINGTATRTARVDGLINGVTYNLWVKAINAGGASPFSARVSGTPLAPPTNIQAAAQTPDSILVSWDSAAEGLDYRVYRSNSGSGNYALVGTSVATSFTNIGLAAGSTYYYKVSSVKGDFESAQSLAMVSATTLIAAYITVTPVAQGDVGLTAQTLVVARGENRYLEVVGSYSAYQWYLDGVVIAGASSRSYMLISSSMKLGAYELTVMVSDVTGARFSGRCRVRVE
jgi:fibronectin type 3 domain-containing protein